MEKVCLVIGAGAGIGGTVANLIATEDLSLNNAVGSVVLTGTVTGTMTVTVTDDSLRCPRNNTFSVTMGGAEGTWT